ncbi:DUF58 domain-containing protein [Tessaracoccus terricola]
MARVPRIQTALALRMRRRTVGLRGGIHASTQVGHSMDFNDLRAYVVGDPVADIDWRTSARHGSLLVKRHFAERRVTLMLVVATGRDLAALARPGIPKSDVAIEAAGTLGALATAHGDLVGMAWWDGARARVERPSNRDVELERMLASIEEASLPTTAPADLTALLEATASATRRRGLVAVVCDGGDLDAPTLAVLRRLAAQHEVMVVTVTDLDPTAPGVAERGVHAVGTTAALEPSFLTDPELAAEINQDRARRTAARNSTLAALGIGHVEVGTPAEALPAVLELVRGSSRVRR